MECVKPQPTTKAPAAWFTGDVWFDAVHAGQEPSRIRAHIVRFSSGARTYWHHHVLGQALHVVSGAALVGTRDGAVFEAHPGGTVTCPPDEEHWHGATPDLFMEHLALWAGAGGDRPEVTWLEQVAGEPYNGRRAHAF